MFMTAEREIDYEALVQGAMRGIVRTVLVDVAKSGLPGQHHFYVAFRTNAPGVVLSKRLKERYPEEMTVVLQHRFWDLIVSDERFEVKLTFDAIPERLVVPFAAIKVFFDPSVPYGLQFEDSDGAPSSGQLAPQQDNVDTDSDVARTGGTGAGRATTQAQTRSPVKKPRSPRASPAEKSPEKSADAPAAVDKPAGKLGSSKTPDVLPSANDAKVVSIDAFRKK
jgi:hypothetical protein